MLTPVLICKQAIIGIDNKLDSNDACMIRGNSLAFHSESSTYTANSAKASGRVMMLPFPLAVSYM